MMGVSQAKRAKWIFQAEGRTLANTWWQGWAWKVWRTGRSSMWFVSSTRWEVAWSERGKKDLHGDGAGLRNLGFRKAGSIVVGKWNVGAGDIHTRGLEFQLYNLVAMLPDVSESQCHCVQCGDKNTCLTRLFGGFNECVCEKCRTWKSLIIIIIGQYYSTPGMMVLSI